jgi:hypothetical protein
MDEISKWDPPRSRMRRSRGGHAHFDLIIILKTITISLPFPPLSLHHRYPHSPTFYTTCRRLLATVGSSRLANSRHRLSLCSKLIPNTIITAAALPWMDRWRKFAMILNCFRMCLSKALWRTRKLMRHYHCREPCWFLQTISWLCKR